MQKTGGKTEKVNKMLITMLLLIIYENDDVMSLVGENNRKNVICVEITRFDNGGSRSR